MFRFLTTAITISMMMGCSTLDMTALDTEASHVTVVFDGHNLHSECIGLDTQIGSEGHWYNFWFITNHALTTGALNQLRNYAASIEGNVVELSPQMKFETSVTFIGHIYRCPKTNNKD